ncbi:maintenance-ploidy protein MOB1 (MPS1 binder 1) [Fonticula alba]|uniref:Maintenance-ploidy protein MOB1 (MPS1 binder 1) n=1 Tax=Fonticula alba TaxID=691883 RepID=A0A058Z8W5_FONAL|nr:maintenance-ploidy protein MOB1 (MPS1 binder 1) [Fonticula alba]KCV70754.1 maintenance-ploidy protein MOB1 (MPS1 binder 1) [Fonticula alba]|eukprot:XP_009495270.1 maintenance-ploidy protein MOB1 (MPS1 binder 1) [Fonticula alba]
MMKLFDKNKTFRPKKKFEPGTIRYELHKKSKASLGASFKIQHSVKLPPGDDLNEWLAVHVVDFFNRINLIYGTLVDFCTPKTCPRMTAGSKFEYYWKDDHQYKQATSVSTPLYVDLLMKWVESQINDESIFPPEVGRPFPKNFKAICANIFRRLTRVFCHVYIHHFEMIQEIGAEAHINACFKHFYYFTAEFKLVDEKELRPLEDFINSVIKESPPAQ